MRNCLTECKVLTDFDFFGKEPEFFYKGKSKKTSFFGLILSVLYIILYIAFFLFKLIRMIKKLDIDFYETYSFSGIPLISLNNQNFYAGFSIGGIIDKQLYYPVLQYWVESRTDGIKNERYVKNIDLEICKLEKFGDRHQGLFREKSLENFYCIKDVQEDLMGYGALDKFSYYYIMIFPCIGTHPDGTECKPLEEVTTFFQRTFLEFAVQDIELTPKDYNNPSEPLIKDITTPVFKGLYQSIFGYFQIVNLETNLDVLGFEAFSDFKYDKFLKYDESWIIASPSPHTITDGFAPGYPVCDVTIQLAAKVLTIKRSNTKLIDLLGDVGGFMEFISSLFTIISMFVTDLLYDIDIVNNLFSFDIDKKHVIIKNFIKEERNNLEEEQKDIYNPEYSQPKIYPVNSRNVKENDILNKKSNEEDKKNDNAEKAIKKTRKRRSKKLSTFNIVSSSQNKDDKDTNTNMEEININRNIKYSKIKEDNKANALSNNQIISIDERYKSNEAQRNILDNVNINTFFVIFAFCCIRKRKNMNSFMLEEGLYIIRERLDILNIFKKMYYEEQLQEQLKIKQNEIKMSDSCKKKLQG